MAFFTLPKGKQVGRPSRDTVTIGKKNRKSKVRGFYISRNLSEALGLEKGSRLQLDIDMDNKLFRVCKTDSPTIGRLVTKDKYGHTVKLNMTMPENVQEMLGKDMHKCKGEVKEENGVKYVYFAI